jgi:glucose/arabinose dehydrogenase
VTLVGGFQDADGRRWGRPADAVAGPDGGLYVSDDTAGAIYRLMPPTTSGWRSPELTELQPRQRA